MLLKWNSNLAVLSNYLILGGESNNTNYELGSEI